MAIIHFVKKFILKFICFCCDCVLVLATILFAIPHCLIEVQWGKAVGTNISVVNFPIAFASTPYVGYLTRTASGNSGDNTVIVRNITKTQLYGEFAYGGSDKGVYWLVIGK